MTALFLIACAAGLLVTWLAFVLASWLNQRNRFIDWRELCEVPFHFEHAARVSREAFHEQESL